MPGKKGTMKNQLLDVKDQVYMKHYDELFDHRRGEVTAMLTQDPEFDANADAQLRFMLEDEFDQFENARRPTQSGAIEAARRMVALAHYSGLIAKSRGNKTAVLVHAEDYRGFKFRDEWVADKGHTVRSFCFGFDGADFDSLCITTVETGSEDHKSLINAIRGQRLVIREVDPSWVA